MRQYGRLTILLPILFVGFLFLPAPSDAQHSSGVIYACVGKYTGLTRIVEANEACRPA